MTVTKSGQVQGNIPSVDASMDVKAALQDLTQLSKSESSIMNPPPLKFEVKVPAGNVFVLNSFRSVA